MLTFRLRACQASGIERRTPIWSRCSAILPQSRLLGCSRRPCGSTYRRILFSQRRVSRQRARAIPLRRGLALDICKRCLRKQRCQLDGVQVGVKARRASLRRIPPA